MLGRTSKITSGIPHANLPVLVPVGQPLQNIGGEVRRWDFCIPKVIMTNTAQQADRKPLIDRLKAERIDLLAKLLTVTDDVRHYRIAVRAATNSETRKRRSTDHARASHALFRIQARLTELKTEIAAENSRLTAAVMGTHASKKFARTGSISEQSEEKTTV